MMIMAVMAVIAAVIILMIVIVMMVALAAPSKASSPLSATNVICATAVLRFYCAIILGIRLSGVGGGEVRSEAVGASYIRLDYTLNDRWPPEWLRSINQPQTKEQRAKSKEKQRLDIT
jgi:hypothetical protein